MKEYKLISIDLAKNVFQVCGFSDFNKVAFNQRINRGKLLDKLRAIGTYNRCYGSLL